jgi:glycosyltransferase involved in cell wall biosynthesis
MKKIHHICFILPSLDISLNAKRDLGGGAETQLLNFSENLANEGQKVSIITRQKIKSNKYLVKNKNIQIFSSPFNYLGGSNFYLFFDWCLLIRLILKIGPDVIILKHPRHLIFLLAIICFLSKKRFFFYAAIDKDVDLKLLFNEPLISRLLYKTGLKFVTGIFAQTIYQANAFQRLTDVNVHYLPSVYCKIPVNGKINSIKQPYILWVGSNSSRKRPYIFKSIADKFPDISFVMIYSMGDGTGGIDENSGPSNLIYLFSCPREKIGSYYYESEFLVSTSALEGFPNTFLESWYFRKPVLSLEIDPDDIIKKYHLGMVAKDLNALYHNFEILINDEKLRNKLGQNGRNYINSIHSPENVIPKFLDIISH